MPFTRWSWMAMPSPSAAALISRVISMSSREGLGSPLGWFCMSNIDRATRVPRLIYSPMGSMLSELNV